MKTNKGFTLPELMGVIVILGIIGLIIFPVIDKTLKESKNDLYETQIKNIQLGAKNWVAENLYNLPQTEGEVLTLTLSQLKQSGNVENNIKNPKTELLFSNRMIVRIEKTANGFDYNVDETSNDIEFEQSDIDSIPNIVLNGNLFSYVELKPSGDYVDLGATAKYPNGTVENDIIKTITKNGTVLDRIPLNSPGTYLINYSWIKDNLSTSVVRTIIVKDSTGPVLTLPADSTITVSQVASFNLNSGVSATDNSGTTPTITSEGSLYPIPGRYTITYTATDSYNNKTVKKRIITVQ